MIEMKHLVEEYEETIEQIYKNVKQKGKGKKVCRGENTR